MNDEAVPVTVQIMDNEYRVACPESEHDALRTAAHYLNNQMLEIRETGKILGVERIAVMAALNISYELLKCQREAESLERLTSSRIQELVSKLEGALSKSKPEQQDAPS